MPTTPKGLWYPDETDNISPLDTVLANMQASTDVAMESVLVYNPAGIHKVADAAGLTALTSALSAAGYPVGPTNPIYAERTDTGLLYRSVASGTWTEVIPTPASFPNVRYDAAQTLTLTEQERARDNIAAAGPDDITGLQDAIDDLVVTTGTGAVGSIVLGTSRIQTGTVTVSMVGSSTGAATVTFPVPFAAGTTVAVFTSVQSSGYANSIDAPTTTGFTVTLRHVDAATPSANRVVMWLAIGIA